MCLGVMIVVSKKYDSWNCCNANMSDWSFVNQGLEKCMFNYVSKRGLLYFLFYGQSGRLFPSCKYNLEKGRKIFLLLKKIQIASSSPTQFSGLIWVFVPSLRLSLDFFLSFFRLGKRSGILSCNNIETEIFFLLWTKIFS